MPEARTAAASVPRPAAVPSLSLESTVPPTPRILSVLLVLTLALVSGCDEVPGSASSSDVPVNAREVQVALNNLTVAASRPMTGYSRDRFSHWRKTGENCDVRDVVLERDGKNLKKNGCNITDGQWYSVYDGLTVKDPLEVDIDHMVPLANAWRSGADKWTDQQRSDFANDLDRPQLIAVSRGSNRSKGDQDPSQWQPPNFQYYCKYAQAWITVKTFWQLTITKDEKGALTDMLGTCV
jgi:hypothetical protein